MLKDKPVVMAVFALAVTVGALLGVGALVVYEHASGARHSVSSRPGWIALGDQQKIPFSQYADYTRHIAKGVLS